VCIASALCVCVCTIAPPSVSVVSLQSIQGMRQSSWLAFSLASFAVSPFSGM
jgi:hypothetical protein